MLIGFINLPLPARATIVALLALLAARFVNWAIYNWAYFSKPLGPWAPPPAKGSRTWFDHLPVIGWFALRREASSHGKNFWLRPLLIEALLPVLLTWYYCYYVSGSAFPSALPGQGMPPGLLSQFHWQFIGHFALFVLMAIATFIDFDEQSIPDYVTVPGTAIGLLGAALAPAWLPFDYIPGLGFLELQAVSPSGLPPWMSGPNGLAIGVAIVLVWGFALLDRRWITRRGFGKAIQYFIARLFRHRRLWVSIFVITAAMLVGVTLAWAFAPGRWNYLLSSLLGLAFAGGVTWGVRLSASAGLGVEALGFGDVTLMAMIGTYVGWQPSLLIFFIAPFTAMLFVLLRWIITGESATPYGPYLCAATVLLLVYWNEFWAMWAAKVFDGLGPVILGIVVACVALMGALLWIWRLIKEFLGIAGH